MKFFFIGERELLLAFELVGVSGTIAVNRDEALEAFSRVTGKGAGAGSLPVEERPKVLIITEEVALMLENEVLQWQMGAQFPLIVEVPGIRGHISGKKSLTDSIREAIGIQV